MEHQPSLNPNPAFLLENMSSVRLDEPFTHLMMHAIDSVTIDGHKLVSVDHFERQQDDTLHVVCSTEENESHLFSFNPYEESEVTHLLLPKEA